MTLVKERSRTRRRPVAAPLLGFLVLVGVCWAIVLAATPSPAGNPVLLTTSPGSAELVKSPDEVVLTFDRPVPAGLATVRVLDPDGSQVVFERPVHPDGREDRISVPMPKERHEGTYAIAWTMPSDRLEPISGTFTFDVFSTIEPEGVPAIETTHDTTVSVVYSTARVLSIVAMGLLAAAVFAVALTGPTRLRRRLIKTSAWALGVGTVVTFLSFGPYAAWAPLRDVLDPRLFTGALESAGGGVLLARLAVLIPVALGIAQLMSLPDAENAGERWWRGATVLGCAAAVFATWTFAEPRSPGGSLMLAGHVAVLTAGALALGGAMLLRSRILCAAGVSVLMAGLVFVAFLPRSGAQAPAAVRDQVAPTRLAFDTGSVDLVVLPENEGQQVRLDTRLSLLGPGDVQVTAKLTGNGQTVPLALRQAGTAYLAGEATLPGRGSWQLSLDVATGGRTQTLTQPIDVR
ncbi:hypothetical protein FPZ12_029235 [Amycolatopsis acidicola]|uniref:CopC domain-containing protein n=1 Tax=Amycolatopsis acidicola TaxID=2596893 RepID=A0A5N0UX28_9PSEU|nr:copper resistance CopC family protein [Amycolatopsis acidicola]KAA9155639.1 hypothetical protein FPZ12_029235 [Amycolatopsis acidicola]